MPDETYLTPDQARARFGELRHGPTGTYMGFPEPTGGSWLPEFGPEVMLTGYRLHRPVRVPASRLPYRPRR